MRRLRRSRPSLPPAVRRILHLTGIALLAGCGGGGGTTACVHEYVIENFGYRWDQAVDWQRAEAIRICRAHPHDANKFGPGSK